MAQCAVARENVRQYCRQAPRDDQQDSTHYGGFEDDPVVRFAFIWVFEQVSSSEEPVSRQDGDKSEPELHSTFP